MGSNMRSLDLCGEFGKIATLLENATIILLRFYQSFKIYYEMHLVFYMAVYIGQCILVGPVSCPVHTAISKQLYTAEDAQIGNSL